MWGQFYLCGEDPRKPDAQAGESRDIVEFARRQLGFEPDERQIEVLRSGAKRGILNCTRQWGKSTTAAVMAVHRALSEDGCVVLVASPSARQSAELVAKARGLLLRIGIGGARRRAQRYFAAAAERVEDYRAAGECGKGARVLGSDIDADRRGGAGGGWNVQIAAADAGGFGRRSVAAEHAVREARILL